MNPPDEDDEEEAETLASVRRGLADVDAGRTYPVEEVFERLEARYAREGAFSKEEIEPPE